MEAPKRSVPDNREQILEAAKTLFLHHGFAKTTIVDISKASKMSHANVYRYFSDKNAIVETIAAEWFAHLEDRLESIATGDGGTEEKLVRLVLTVHDFFSNLICSEPQMFEICLLGISRKSVVVQKHIKAIREAIAAILRRARDAGELYIEDLEITAQALQDATIKFCHPSLIAEMPDGEQVQPVKNIVRIIIKGLAKQ